MDPTYSTPVQAPPTEMPIDYDDNEDEDIEEFSGQELEMTTVEGEEYFLYHYNYFRETVFVTSRLQ